jgi:hypothetical protein
MAKTTEQVTEEQRQMMRARRCRYCKGRIGGRGWQVPVDAEGWPCHVWCSA